MPCRRGRFVLQPGGEGFNDAVAGLHDLGDSLEGDAGQLLGWTVAEAPLDRMPPAFRVGLEADIHL